MWSHATEGHGRREGPFKVKPREREGREGEDPTRLWTMVSFLHAMERAEEHGSVESSLDDDRGA